jgi:TRAP-type uncharacterized transport system fused permease subunit
MAALPAALYYLSIIVTVEADARRLALAPADLPSRSFAAVTREGWYFFLPMIAIFVLMARGTTAFLAVFWATIVAVGVSFFSREHALWPRRLAVALSSGGLSVVPVVATTAAAGIIVGVVTLTGLGLKAAGLIATLAANNLLLTAIYSGLAVWLLGLAMPVTASYIIAAVMVAPALTQVGVSPPAAHMFVFYYAVLSEVSPPTALSPFAAAAITGGNPFTTTMLTWKYTVPAFVLPFIFTVSPRGTAVLLDGSTVEILRASTMSALGLIAIGAGTGGHTWHRASALERALAIAAGLAILAMV